LTRLAAASGGEAFFPIAVDELASNYQRVVERLRRRYVASYVSSNPRRGGEWRRVEIVSHIPGVAITSRGGYFAPKD
jgi:hypothetical protein